MVFLPCWYLKKTLAFLSTKLHTLSISIIIIICNICMSQPGSRGRGSRRDRSEWRRISSPGILHLRLRFHLRRSPPVQDGADPNGGFLPPPLPLPSLPLSLSLSPEGLLPPFPHASNAFLFPPPLSLSGLSSLSRTASKQWREGRFGQSQRGGGELQPPPTNRLLPLSLSLSPFPPLAPPPLPLDSTTHLLPLPFPPSPPLSLPAHLLSRTHASCVKCRPMRDRKLCVCGAVI